ncbi:MAG: ACP S-malonyltransferase [Betaproteobacteria bacterium]|nr:ACP S-malonyltransferase [Betaproteobacteria bacterium]
MKFAFVFPGQGSQSVGMMQGFAESSPVRKTFDQASEVLGQDLWKLVAEGPADDLNSTVNTQPLMLTAAYAVYQAWLTAGGPKPAMAAGHSLGEYTALVAAGALAFRDALPLVRFRAQAMQDAVPRGEGAMAAILGLDDDAVRAACGEAAQGQVVEVVNFNAPSQIVIAGHKAAVERGVEAARARGAKRAVMLPVSAPFHSSLLKPAAAKLVERLANIVFSVPQIPVVNNVDVAVVNDPEKIRDALARQAASPVRWTETVRQMSGAGITHVAECGPGKVLAGLTKRIDGALQGIAITDLQSLEQALQVLK